MITTGINKKVQIQQIVENQIPEFLLSEGVTSDGVNKFSEFLKQYYISQEYTGGPVDISDNLDQYLKLDNLTPEVVVDSTILKVGISTNDTTISVNSTKGFPDKYGLLKIGDEVITYKGITTDSFLECERGFSGITSYYSSNNTGELIFSDSASQSHAENAIITNLSTLFLKQFYKKLKYTLTPGLENVDFVPNLNVGNFLKEARSFYESKGTEESFRILFNVLYGVNPKIIDLEEYLIKPSSARYLRREIIVAEQLSGNPIKLEGQTVVKSDDSTSTASVSEVEKVSGGILNTLGSGSTTSEYFSLDIFVGYDDEEAITGTFTIPGKTKVIGLTPAGSSVIAVDSTIGFSTTGTLIHSGLNTSITYSGKTINQFLDCEGIREDIHSTDNLRSDETIFGYEGGDTSKKVELRITGVLADFVSTDSNKLSVEGEKIYVKNLGEKIEHVDGIISTKKQVNANSWVYNTSSRYQISTVNQDTGGTTLILFSKIDRSSLKVGDNIEVLERVGNFSTGQNVVLSTKVTSLQTNNSIGIGNSFIPVLTKSYDIRRILNKSTSSGVPIQYGNNNIISDIQNVYNELNENIYVASNSLPSYDIKVGIAQTSISELNSSTIQGYNTVTNKYSIISFSSDVPFITGDEVYYKPTTTSLFGLSEGTYYVEVQELKNQIKLYLAPSFIASNDVTEFSLPVDTQTIHTFTLLRHLDGELGNQKLLRKLPINPNLKTGNNVKTTPGSIGMMINGVEIENYKSIDNIFYGPLEDFDVLNPGIEYDVINPPSIEIAAGIGLTALVQPVVSGNIKNIFVDPQDYDIENITSVKFTGGNGTGAILKPIIKKRYREVLFAGINATNGISTYGIDYNNETIVFKGNHNLKNGQAVVYNRNGYQPIGITTTTSNALTDETLDDNVIYYPEVVGLTSIRLYKSFSDYTSGINTVGFNTGLPGGEHIIRLYKAKNTLDSIKIIESGKSYANKKLYVKPTGISTFNSTINYEDHGFLDGDNVVYSNTSVAIPDLSSSIQYKVLKLNDNSFRLSNAGVGGTITIDYNRKKYVGLSSIGAGYHLFKYPDIKLTVSVEYSGISSDSTDNIIFPSRTLTSTPVVRGNISNAYMYESGTGYGSSIINFENKPILSLKSGKNAEVFPVVLNGKIVSINVGALGTEYHSVPDLEIEGDGVGAELRPVITNNQLTDVIIINGGANYTENNTTIKVKSAGRNAVFAFNVRKLPINNLKRYGDEILLESLNKLRYSVVGYSTDIGKNHFDDNGISHSPIIGWAYDGNPIYGPKGYSDAYQRTDLTILKTGYVLDTSKVTDRPLESDFEAGFFVDDYVYTNIGNLDEHNGRFCRTPEYPNGTYAYFVGVSTSFGKLKPTFPYFIGDSYRSEPVTLEEKFTINQDLFDFNNSNLVRNTFPYKVGDEFAGNDFFIESYELTNQESIVESVTPGSVDGFDIVTSGESYKVNDNLIFDNDGTEGNGLNAYVKSLEGKTIVDINTNYIKYENVSFTWHDNGVSAYISTSHELNNNDQIIVSGLSTSIKYLTGSHKIGVSTDKSFVYSEIPSNATAGTVADIVVSNIDFISIGSSIGIGTEKLLVLNKFNDKKVLRVLRGVTGTAHTISSRVSLIPSFLSIPLDIPKFDSKIDDIIYFNPFQSIGVGTISGISSAVDVTVSGVTDTISIPAQSIYLPNHPFKTNQQLTFKRGSGSVIGVSTDGTISGGFNIDANDTLFAINKSSNFIGIVTHVGLTTSSDGLYFLNNGSNYYDYSLESNFSQVTGTVIKALSTVSVSTSHGLSNGDIINLSITPNKSVGIGTSTAVRLKYNQIKDILLINTLGFSSTGINTETNVITLSSHGFETGNKVFYDSNDNVSGLTTDGYFVYRIDDNNIQLTETLNDSTKNPPSVVSLASTGGSTQELSLINPPIPIINNNNLVFDVSDTSLGAYDINFYYDSNFNNRFVSTGQTNTFTITRDGVIGSGADATVTVNYDINNPQKLYYNIEKAGYISTSDSDVTNRSEIFYTDSTYSGEYVISGVGETTFSIFLNRNPESLSYEYINVENSGIGTLTYNTNSDTASGGVGEVGINFGGIGYKELPQFISIASSEGVNASILPTSELANKVDGVRIANVGFEYPSDKTLRPTARLSPVISLRNYDVVGELTINDGGFGYEIPPNLVVVDSISREVIDNGVLQAVVNGSSIVDINIIVPTKGLDVSEVYAVDNANGIRVNNVTIGGTVVTDTYSGIVTCTLATPLGGFSEDPFEVGDLVFVEGIENEYGDTFNSASVGYRFYEVTKIGSPKNPFKITFNLSGISTNPGLAKTTQTYASVVNYKKYPKFDVIQKQGLFIEGEKVLVWNGNEWSDLNLYIDKVGNDYIKISGNRDLYKNDRLRGYVSGILATINEIHYNSGVFEVDYSSKQNKGWIDEIGKLNEDYQVLPDNDYYQSLSYTIQSPVEFKELISSVNRLVHTTGLKNFADTGITSAPKAIGINSIDATTITRDLQSENRVDSINNFDVVTDVDIISNPERSRYIRFENRILSDYFECKTNRVLKVDNISNLFSNTTNNAVSDGKLQITSPYGRYLIQTRNPQNNKIQVEELVVNIDYFTKDVYTIQKGALSDSSIDDDDSLVSVIGNKNNKDEYSLLFTPVDTQNIDLEIKVFENTFNSVSGVGTTSFGFTDLTSINQTVGVGTTVTLISVGKSFTESYFASVELQDNTSQETNIVDVYVTHDGTNSYIANYQLESNTTNAIGTFTSNIDSSNNLLLNYENTSGNEIVLQSRIVGFGTTSVGIGTYRFKKSTQPAGSENTVRLESQYANVSSASTVAGFSTAKDTAVKSLVRVSIGETSAIHQVLFAHNTQNTFTLQYPFISIGSSSGIGTFSSEFNGSNLNLIFHPDSSVSGNIEVQSYNEVINKKLDSLNIPPDLEYGSSIESVSTLEYKGTNNTSGNIDEFVLKYKDVPIFGKYFEPVINLNLATGLFTIPSHFFSNNEEILYTPGSSYDSVGFSSIVMSDGNGLPSTVYIVENDKDSFFISTSLGGAATTFNTVGTGNYHLFEMSKKLEKSLIVLDNIIQTPLTWTPIKTTLFDNISGQVSISTTLLSLTGIGTISNDSIVRIDDEYIKIVNVGLGTTSLGPIGESGSFNLVEVERGFVGSTATIHVDGTEVRLYQGAYNIVGQNLYFAGTPHGNNSNELDKSNLPPVNSNFSGRAYLRKNYSTNEIFDDISENFTGIGRTFTMQVSGANTTGVQTGSTLMTINGIFQPPTTENNSNFNYFFDKSTAGISSIVYTGITSDNGSIIISDIDVNQNQLPRSGQIISIGSSGGIGIAPLAGAAVTAIIGTGKSIASVGLGTLDMHGSGYTAGLSTDGSGIIRIGIVDESYEHRFVSADDASITPNVGSSLTPTNATYESSTGTLILTIPSHGLTTANTVGIATNSIVFTCSKDNFTTNHNYPRTTDPAHDISISIGATTVDTISVNVGPGGGAGAGASITAQVIDFNEHRFVNSGVGSITIGGGGALTATTGTEYNPLVGILTITTTGAHGLVASGFQTATNAKYNPHSGIMTLTTVNNHNFVTGDYVKLAKNSLTFTCDKDNYTSNHYYPRVGDPIYNKWVAIGNTTLQMFEIQVLDTIPSTNVTTHNFVSAAASGIQKANNTVGIITGGLNFTCAQDNHVSNHYYPRVSKVTGGSDPAYNAVLGVEEVLSTTKFTINVGKSPHGTGGALSFNVVEGGSGYVNPIVQCPTPFYQNMPIEGISRRGIGQTTDTGNALLIDVEVGASQTTGIGSVAHAVQSYKISRTGYAFEEGDVFRPTGLVTSRYYSSLVTDFKLTVNEIFTDKFACWNVGDFDYIDSVKPLQNGIRRRFPLYYNTELVSFQTDPSDKDSQEIDLDSCLLIFVNGVVQVPGESYNFGGGTSILFTEAPDPEDNLSIFFYKGTNGEDSVYVDVPETIKSGDNVQIIKNDVKNITGSESITQDERVIVGITTSDTIETNLYYGLGIDVDKPANPIKWTKQKTDKIIGGEVVYKSRASIEPLIFPNAGIISDFSITDTTFFVDSTDLFNYEGDTPLSINAFVIDPVDPVAASLTAVVSAAGTVSSISVVDGGLGYVGATTSVSIGLPPSGLSGVGVDPIALGTANITDGSISSVDVTNPGRGYSESNPPQVLAPLPSFKFEEVRGISGLGGFSGIITGISTTTGTGSNPLALKFFVERVAGEVVATLKTGHPIVIFNTNVGSGVTSIYDDGAVVGIGTTFLDNIYRVNSVTNPGSGNRCEFIANVDPGSPVTGINTYDSAGKLGSFSWGTITGITTRSSANPIAIGVSGLTVDSGLSTFPYIQRRNAGIRDTGALESKDTA
tara:strand:+ start:3319 stop:16308 length:12990 start_codon:yes stop_codon:yes gene_type:complete